MYQEKINSFSNFKLIKDIHNYHSRASDQHETTCLMNLTASQIKAEKKSLNMDKCSMGVKREVLFEILDLLLKGTPLRLETTVIYIPSSSFTLPLAPHFSDSSQSAPLFPVVYLLALPHPPELNV